MGLYDPQIRVPTAGTGAASGKNYAVNAATAGLVFTAQGDDVPPLWQPNVPIIDVGMTLFVDGMNAAAGADGSFAKPFATIQEAVNAAVAATWTDLLIYVAPGNYPGAINIPDTLFTTSIIGWNVGIQPATPRTLIWADITVNSQPFVIDSLIITDCQLLAGAIHTGGANQGLHVELVRTQCAAPITADTLEVWQVESVQTGAVTGNLSLATRFDPFSWTSKVAFLVPYAPANYTRDFWGAGQNRFAHTLTVNGVAIGTTAFVNVAATDVRVGDWATLQVSNPAAVDFIAGFHSSAAGQLTFWLTNLSRVSTNFAEACESLITHATMATQPP